MKRLTIEDESEGEDKSEHNFKVENKLENKFANLQIEFANFGFRQQIWAYFWKICAKTLYSTLLLVDMTSVFKKEDVFLLKIYRPVSVLHVVSKIYERVIQKQILEYVDKHLSPPHMWINKKVQYTTSSNIHAWKMEVIPK